MKKTYADVVEQIAKLQAEADALKQKEVQAVIARIREAITAYGLKPQDLFAAQRAKVERGAGKRRRGAPQAARPSAGGRHYKRYSNGEGGTWNGIGPRPKWLKEALASGKQLSDFLVGG